MNCCSEHKTVDRAKRALHVQRATDFPASRAREEVVLSEPPGEQSTFDDATQAPKPLPDGRGALPRSNFKLYLREPASIRG
jgi:hypothetical protein